MTSYQGAAEASHILTPPLSSSQNESSKIEVMRKAFEKIYMLDSKEVFLPSGEYVESFDSSLDDTSSWDGMASTVDVITSKPEWLLRESELDVDKSPEPPKLSKPPCEKKAVKKPKKKTAGKANGVGMVLRYDAAYRVWIVFMERKFQQEGLRHVFLYAMGDKKDKTFGPGSERKALKILIENTADRYHWMMWGTSSAVWIIRALKRKCSPENLEREAYSSLVSMKFGDLVRPRSFFEKVRVLSANLGDDCDLRDESKLVSFLVKKFPEGYEGFGKGISRGSLDDLEKFVTERCTARKLARRS
ncbi:unnamed protein product [Kuraishia capsulata CBS 1993]|uniref:Uncharacterized protein n=1 Tax=Kuraishia capsulata CBS 1993 TaxID=1382522 RepID=W6MLX6_9ASCO|nr:uncharacterized protein KUCA_T00003497001 [Kuraishia capsulata CBS 1993]CDK27519.1 unnamed protein product [Kuraishia capsulata CBS 1993]